MNTDINFDFSVPVEKQELNVVVHNLSKNIVNLCNITEKINTTIEQDNVPCNVFDLTWLFEEKCKIIDNIKQEINNSEMNLPTSDGEIFIQLYKTLVNENKQQLEVLEHLQDEVKSQEDHLNKMKQFLHLIEVNNDSIGTNEVEIPKMLDITLLQKNSAAKMLEIRIHLHKLLDICFDKKTKQLIEDLTVAYFKGGDNKYINISEEYVLSDINFLKGAGLIVTDPYNDMRIKMDDICD